MEPLRINTPIITTKTRKKADHTPLSHGSSGSSVVSPSHTSPELLKQLKTAKKNKQMLRKCSEKSLEAFQLYSGVDDDDIQCVSRIIQFGKNEYFQYKLRSFTRRKIQKRINNKRVNHKKKSRNRTKRQV